MPREGRGQSAAQIGGNSVRLFFTRRMHVMEDPQDLISVYQAANTTEAYIVHNLLVDAGIAAEVSEENEPSTKRMKKSGPRVPIGSVPNARPR
jgi:hypothetical protein